MNCQEVMELMQRHIDGDLDQQETSDMMNHVDQCRECSEMLERLTRLSHELEQLPHVLPRYSLVDAIMPELDRLHTAQEVETAEASRPLPLRSSRSSTRGFRWMGGVVAASLAIGFLLFTQDGPWSLSSSKSKLADQQLENQASVARSYVALTGDGMAQDLPPSSPEFDALQPAEQEAMQRAADVLEAPSGSSMAIDQYGKPVAGAGQDEPSMLPEEVPLGELNSSSMVDKDKFTSGEEGTGNLVAERAAADTVAPSPDSKWQAVLSTDSGVLQIYDTTDERLVYESAPREGMLSEPLWASDSSELHYVWTDPEGRQLSVIYSVADLLETVQQP